MSLTPRTSGPRRWLALLFALLALLSLSGGCTTLNALFDKVTFGKEQKELEDAPETLINEGMEAYGVGDYQRALRAFDAILDKHPFASQAILAELKAADSHYYQEDYLEAKMLYKEFEERHPTNEAIPYVMFQYGMCDFARTDRIDRDITGAKEAIQSFNRLLRAYPDSPYTAEAEQRIRAAKEFLVNHEYMVAVFYVRQEKYDQAKHRLRYLIASYPDSAMVGQAQTLLDKLEAGEPPALGMNKWLPSMPKWMKWGSEADPEQHSVSPSQNVEDQN
jgi:outer membrane protein assembly factor BamD